MTEVPDSMEAYLTWCDKNGEKDVFQMISEAIDDGRGDIVYEGFLPPSVIDYLSRDLKYDVQVIESMGVKNRNFISWATK